MGGRSLQQWHGPMSSRHNQVSWSARRDPGHGPNPKQTGQPRVSHCSSTYFRVESKPYIASSNLSGLLFVRFRVALARSEHQLHQVKLRLHIPLISRVLHRRSCRRTVSIVTQSPPRQPLPWGTGSLGHFVPAPFVVGPKFQSLFSFAVVSSSRMTLGLRGRRSLDPPLLGEAHAETPGEVLRGRPIVLPRLQSTAKEALVHGRRRPCTAGTNAIADPCKPRWPPMVQKIACVESWSNQPALAYNVFVKYLLRKSSR